MNCYSLIPTHCSSEFAWISPQITIQIFIDKIDLDFALEIQLNLALFLKSIKLTQFLPFLKENFPLLPYFIYFNKSEKAIHLYGPRTRKYKRYTGNSLLQTCLSSIQSFPQLTVLLGFWRILPEFLYASKTNTNINFSPLLLNQYIAYYTSYYINIA